MRKANIEETVEKKYPEAPVLKDKRYNLGNHRLVKW